MRALERSISPINRSRHDRCWRQLIIPWPGRKGPLPGKPDVPAWRWERLVTLLGQSLRKMACGRVTMFVAAGSRNGCHLEKALGLRGHWVRLFIKFLFTDDSSCRQ